MEDNLAAWLRRQDPATDPRTAARVLLSWVIAGRDAELSSQHQTLLMQRIPIEKGQLSEERAIRKKQKRLIKACHTVQQAASDATYAQMMIEIAFDLILAEGRLRTEVNHATRFLADLAQVTPQQLNVLFERRTQRPFPLPRDPSYAQYWYYQDQRTHQTRGNSKVEKKQEQVTQLIAARRRLGVKPDATKAEVMKAYRRTVQRVHPDRFANKGKKAQAEAADRFRQAQKDYQTVLAHA